MEKTYIHLMFNEWKKWFTWEKDGKYYYVVPAGDAKSAATGVLFRCFIYHTKEAFDEKLSGKYVDADQIASIKEFHKNDKTRLWGMLFDNPNKKAFFINLYDNDMRSPDKNYDKLLVLAETEWREKSTPAVEGEKPF